MRYLKRILLLTTFTIFGCSGTSLQTIGYTPTANTCSKMAAHDFWSSSVAMVCFDSTGMPIGQTGGTSQAPLDVLSSSANAAIIMGGITAGTALLPGASSSAVAGKP